MTSQNVPMEYGPIWLFEHFFKGLSLYLEARIWIRIRVKSRIRIRICIKLNNWKPFLFAQLLLVAGAAVSFLCFLGYTYRYDRLYNVMQVLEVFGSPEVSRWDILNASCSIYTVLWIRIRRIGSGLDPDSMGSLDPHPNPRQKMTHKIEKS